jgi:hypothetical protein
MVDCLLAGSISPGTTQNTDVHWKDTHVFRFPAVVLAMYLGIMISDAVLPSWYLTQWTVATPFALML